MKTATAPAAAPDDVDPTAVPAPVVVGYDGVMDGLGAVRWALEALPIDTPIIVVSALGHERRLPIPFPRLESAEVLRARLEELWMEDAQAIDSELELLVEQDAPAAALLRVAQERGARLVILGHRRRGRLGVLHASVAHDLIEHSPVPVVVVP